MAASDQSLINNNVIKNRMISVACKRNSPIDGAIQLVFYKNNCDCFLFFDSVNFSFVATGEIDISKFTPIKREVDIRTIHEIRCEDYPETYFLRFNDNCLILIDWRLEGYGKLIQQVTFICEESNDLKSKPSSHRQAMKQFKESDEALDLDLSEWNSE